MNERKVLVTGSLAFDHIMDFPGRFAKHILPNKIHLLNLSFLVKTLKKQWGGTAGNIAYNLSLLGEKSAILAAVGKDFDPYAKHLRKRKIDLTLVKKSKSDSTASLFIITDQDDNQIAGFYPGAMSFAKKLSIKSLNFRPDLVVISPNDPQAMVRYCFECHQLKLPYVFDPSQQIPRLSKSDIVKCIGGSILLIGNEYEIELIKDKTGLSEAEIAGKLTKTLIVTKGRLGSVILSKEKKVIIPAVSTKRLVDPTGAGDAYRSGILKGLVHDYDWETAGRVASVAAVFAVEKYGTQVHNYTRRDFVRRYQENFGRFPESW